MFNQIEDMLLNTFIEKLNAHGVKIDAQTVKNAIAKSPQIVVQVEQIMMSNSQDRMEKIVALLNQTAQGSAAPTPPNLSTPK